jgi:hypothetical protein
MRTKREHEKNLRQLKCVCQKSLLLKSAIGRVKLANDQMETVQIRMEQKAGWVQFWRL